MALTVLTDASATSDSRTLTWTIPTLASGDVVVVGVVTWDGANTQNAPSGTGLTFTQQLAVGTGFGCRVYLWTAVAASGGSSVAVTCSILAGGASMHNGTLWHCPTADGYSLAGSPNTLTVGATVNGQAGPTVTGNITGTSGSLACMVAGDCHGSDWSGRAWSASGTEDMYVRSATDSTQAAGHATLTGASTTIGLTGLPTGALSETRLIAVEVLKSGGGPPALPPIIVLPPRRH